MIGSFLSNIFGMIGINFGGQVGTQNPPPPIIKPPNNTPLFVIGGLILVVVLVLTLGKSRGR